MNNRRGVRSIIRNHLPSRIDTLSVFAACALPVFAWAIISYLYALPGFVVRLSIWDIIGTASYVLTLALFESLLLTVPFLLVAVVLPSHLFKDRFVALSSVIVLVSSLWMMYANYYRIDLASWDTNQVLTSLTLYLLTLAIPIALVLRYKRFEGTIQKFTQRVAVLVYFYVGLAAIGVVVILIRNI